MHPEKEELEPFPPPNYFGYIANILFWQAAASLLLGPLSYGLIKFEWEWQEAPGLLLAVAIDFFIGFVVAKIQIENHPYSYRKGAKFVRIIMVCLAALIWLIVKNPDYGWAGIISVSPAFITSFWRLDFSPKANA